MADCKSIFLLAILAVTLQNIQVINADRILGYLITPSRSHFIVHDSLMRGLAAKGHEVLVLSLFPSPETPSLPTYRSIQLDMSSENTVLMNSLLSNLLDDADDSFFLLKFPKMMRGFGKIFSDTLEHPEVKRIQRDEKFDLVVFAWFLNDFHLGIAAHFQCPSVMVATMPPGKQLRDYVGNPSAVAYAPTPILQLSTKDQLTYLQRVANMLGLCIETIVVKLINKYFFEPKYVAAFPAEKYPSFQEAKLNVSLVLVTSHFSESVPIPLLPNLVEVSGMHIKRKPDPLPQDIKEWLDSATDGAIYFSLGSNIKSTAITEEKRNAILRSFSKLKQKVLWKWEDENLPGKPENVKISKWLPQDDVLAHPNVKVFISHCGKGSLNEAKYHGVPILGIPVFADQPANLKIIINEGWGVGVKYHDITEETFTAGLVEILNNQRYSKVVKRTSNLYRDRPMHPLDTAVYWVEYVLRHKGAKHLQSQAVHLNWFQTHSLDVVALILVVIFVSIKVFLFSVKFLCRKCFGKSRKTKKE